jgi:histidyl-tRNA synthetase
MDKIRTVKGTHDILPIDSIKWQKLEKIIYQTCKLFNFKEIRTPVFEKTNLFSRSVGELTDIVSKEMYSWEDRDGTSLTLRPELTASVVRAYTQHNLQSHSPIQRLFYIGPIFRRERPQKGRQRQFHQFGVEAFGSDNPEQDAEIISLAWHLLSKLNIIDGITLKINSLGSPECREKYRLALRDFIRPHLGTFSETSKVRFTKNPLRILDSKNINEINILKTAPPISNFYTPDDESHFRSVLNFLDKMKIKHKVSPQLVRGLDYYTKTVFEFTSEDLGAQDAILGGGRYDNLVETLGGKPTAGIGFAAGIERFLIALESKGFNFETENPDIYFVCIEKEAIELTLTLTKELREKDFSVTIDPLRRSMKAQLREANKLGAELALIIGESEMKSNSIIIKNLSKNTQKTCLQSELFNFL